MLNLTPTNGVNKYLYSGPIGVTGTDVTQSFDLSILPANLLEDPTFKDNWRIFARQVDDGITAVSGAITFTPSSGIPEALVLTLTSDDVANVLDIEFWYLNSPIR